MLMTLALLGTALAPAQKDLEFENTRFTYGIMGQSRKGDKFLPGDVVNLAFDVKGLKVKDDGMVSYSMGFEITKKGQQKPVQKREPTPMRTLNWLGGGDLPSFAYWPIPTDDESPGEYTMKITVTDAESKKTATLSKTFTVEKAKLGFVRTAFTHPARHDDPIPAPPICVTGQTLLLHYTLVGFELDKKTKATDVTVTIRVLDDKGKPTVAKSLKSDIKSDAKDVNLEEKGKLGFMVFRPAQIELNRPGKYKVELTAKCNVTEKTTKEELDLTVLEVK